MSHSLARRLFVAALFAILLPILGPATADAAEAKDMRQLGFNDLQGRSAYQPVIHQQGSRWIAYIGLHGGTHVNPLTGVAENNGTLIVEVTNPRQPVLLRHIPGPSGVGEAGGAQMVRVCNGSDLPAGNPSRVYLLRSFGGDGHQIYNVANPSNPTLVRTIVSGLNDTHKSWWECDSGIAYLVSGVPGWRADRMTQVFDLSSPENPVHIRDYGLVGQEPGSTGSVPTDLHGPISVGQRVYFAHGTSTNGIVQIVDRTKLITGPPAPTPENLTFPVIAQVDLSPINGAHTTFPVLGVPVPGLGEFAVGGTRDILVVVNEATGNRCSGAHQMVFFMDITREDKPQMISNFHVREEPGNFCSRGGRFGAHASNENMTPIYYGRVVFVSYFNAGVRAIDIRDPFRPVEIGYFIPSLTSKAIPVGGTRVIQTNNVEVDNRGYIYIVDRAGNGLHILELAGRARDVANFPQ